MSGVILALIAAAIFGFQNAAARRGVITATPLQGMIITVPTVVPLLAVVSYCLGGFAAVQTWPYQTYMLAGAAGVMHFVIGRFSNYNSMQALGSTLSTPIQQLGTVASLFCAVTILGESLTGLNIFGIVLVSIGPALLIMRATAICVKRSGHYLCSRFETRNFARDGLCRWLWRKPHPDCLWRCKAPADWPQARSWCRRIWQEGHLLIHQLFCYFPIFLPRPAWSSWA